MFYRNSKLRNLKLQYRFLCKTEEESLEHLMCYCKSVEVLNLGRGFMPKNEHKMLHSRIFCSRNSVLIINHVLKLGILFICRL